MYGVYDAAQRLERASETPRAGRVGGAALFAGAEPFSEAGFAVRS